MKQQPPYSALLLLAFLTIMIYGCRSRNKFPYEEGNVEQYIISIDKATRYTQQYRSAVTELSRKVTDENFLKTGFQLPVAVQFNKDVLALLLNQKDKDGNTAEGIRMYFAKNDVNQVTLVLVPHHAKNKDIINKLISKDVAFVPGVSSAFADQITGQAVDNALRCPTFCDITSDLNGNIELLSPGQ